MPRPVHQRQRVYCLEYDRDTEMSCYFYLRLYPGREDRFLRAIQDKAPLDMRQFGEVVASGWGRPGAGVQEEMAKRYQVIPV